MIKYKYSRDLQKNLDERTFRSLQAMTNTEQPTSEFARTIIQFIINKLDADKTLTGLFRLIKFANKHRISPFLATQDYCVKILSIDTNGKVELNISPIYHLGPEYPEYYKEKQGKDLNREAIIGLLEIETPDPDKPSKFNLGIDAGIAFSQAKISHNKRMNLDIQLIDDGILATLQCEEQSTSKVFSWDEMGMPSAAHTDLYNEKVQNLWAA
jgi:hypothetical protein